MTKQKALTIVILVVLVAAVFIIKSGDPKRNETALESSSSPLSREENSKISSDNKVLTIDSVLEDIRPIIKWESDQYSRATILWNTEKEELKLEGRGYLFGDLIGSTDLKEKHGEIKIYLRDSGFEHDKYNVGNSTPGYERSILKLNDIGCELYLRDDERKDSTDMGILCANLPSEVLISNSEPMSEKRARSIAETSECVNDGALKENAFYNESSKTWWIDLDIDKPGCNPACVVYEDETVEINWRCTGLIP